MKHEERRARKRGRKNGLPRNRSDKLGTFSRWCRFAWKLAAYRSANVLRMLAKTIFIVPSRTPSLSITLALPVVTPSTMDSRTPWLINVRPLHKTTIRAPLVTSLPPPSRIHDRSSTFYHARLVTDSPPHRLSCLSIFSVYMYQPRHQRLLREQVDRPERSFKLTDCISNKSRILLTRLGRATAKLNGARKTCPLMFLALVVW